MNFYSKSKGIKSRKRRQRKAARQKARKLQEKDQAKRRQRKLFKKANRAETNTAIGVSVECILLQWHAIFTNILNMNMNTNTTTQIDNSDLAMPSGLSEQGQTAYRIIVEYLTQNDLMPKSVDWRVFHAPAE